jgi:hypothetical protein
VLSEVLKYSFKHLACGPIQVIDGVEFNAAIYCADRLADRLPPCEELFLGMNFSASGILKDTENCSIMDENVWLAEQNSRSSYFTLDLGCLRAFDTIQLRNHYNSFQEIIGYNW